MRIKNVQKVQLLHESDNYIDPAISLCRQLSFIYDHADKLIDGRCVVRTGHPRPLVSRFGTAFLPMQQTGQVLKGCWLKAGAAGTLASNQAISQATKEDHRLLVIAGLLHGALG